MELLSETVGRVVVVRLAAPEPLEADNVGVFREAMANLLQDTDRVLVNMSNVTFLDSSGLGALVAIWRNISSKNGEIKLCNIGPSVRTVFEITRMHRIFEIYDGEEEALASFISGSEGQDSE